MPAYIGCESTLVIEENSSCSKTNDKWKSIQVGDDMCNSLTTVSITDNDRLTSMIIGDNSFNSVTKLTFMNNPIFNLFTVGNNTFSTVTSLIIESICHH